MDVFEYDFQHYLYSTLSDKNPTYLTLFGSAKNKVPIENHLKIFILLNNNYKLITNYVTFNIASEIIIYTILTIKITYI
jgi:hypothetical protein